MLIFVEVTMLDAVDRQIIHILAIEPRASFRTLAEVTGISDQTAARRYRRLSESAGLRVLGVVGRDGGYTKKAGDCVVVIPTVEESRVTPHAEAFQAVVWHCLVSHPKLQKNATKW